ncbi:hypothetical protein GGI23_001713, partial [Coemansia sp. RSA 2559]
MPLVIYYGKMCISGIGNQVVDRHNSKIRTLRKELKEKLDELKKKTAFDSTKSLIDRYSMSNKTPGQDGNEGGNPMVMQAKGGQAAQLRQRQQQQQQQQQDLKSRRPTMPKFNTTTPDTQDSTATRQSPRGNADTPGSDAASPLAAKTMQRQGPYRGTTLGPVPHAGGALGMGQTAGVVRMSPRKASAHQGASGMAGNAVSRPWLDKLVDQLVGDVGSEEDKYALICRHCYAHNGLVLEEEIEDIQYTCPKCGNFNPSVRALRARSQDDILQRRKPIGRQSDIFLESSLGHAH